jgi:MraZ protein
MLLGEHEHTLDDKNRLTFPAKFRATFAGGVVLTRGMDKCLYVYRPEDWNRLVETRLGPLDPLSKEGRRMQRFFFTGAAEAELDRQGRVMVPSALIQHAGLGRNVVVAGMRDHLEIWDAAAWRTELKEVEGSAEDVAERLATRPD